MAGGLGRAQGAYDEMVFRSMVRDGARFYDPLGLVSEGTKIDFQIEVNSYLYGTRFMSYLAYRYSPEDVVALGTRAATAARRTTRRSSSTSSARPLEKAWQRLDRVGAGLPAEEPRRDPPVPRHAVPRTSRRSALGSVSRAYFDPKRRALYAAFNYPGVVAHVGAISTRHGRRPRASPTSRARGSTRSPRSPSTREQDALLHDRQQRLPRPRGARPGDRAEPGCCSRTRASATSSSTAPTRALGHPPPQRHRDARAHPARRTPTGRMVYSWPYGDVVYDLDVSPDGTLLSASVGEIERATDAAGHEGRVAASRATRRRWPRSTSATAIPSNFVFSPDGRYLYGSSYYTGVSNIFRYDLATGKLDAVTNTETGFFRPIPLGGDALIVFRYTGRASCRRASRRSPSQDVSPITFLGAEIVEAAPDRQGLEARLAGERAARLARDRAGPIPLVAGVRLESVYPVVQGYKDTAAVGRARELLRPADAQPRDPDRVATRRTPTCPRASATTCRASYSATTGRSAFQVNDADFYDLVGPTQARASRATRSASATTARWCTTSRGSSTSRSASPTTATSTGSPTTRASRRASPTSSRRARA